MDNAKTQKITIAATPEDHMRLRSLALDTYSTPSGLAATAMLRGLAILEEERKAARQADVDAAMERFRARREHAAAEGA